MYFKAPSAISKSTGSLKVPVFTIGRSLVSDDLILTVPMIMSVSNCRLKMQQSKLPMTASQLTSRFQCLQLAGRCQIIGPLGERSLDHDNLHVGPVGRECFELCLCSSRHVCYVVCWKLDPTERIGIGIGVIPGPIGLIIEDLLVCKCRV